MIQRQALTTPWDPEGAAETPQAATERVRSLTRVEVNMAELDEGVVVKEE